MDETTNGFVSFQPAKMPRLLYIGDVQVEASRHGSVLLYRLLQDYPSALMICEFLSPSQVERRLPNVQYVHVNIPGWRLLYSRFHRYAAAAMCAIAHQAPPAFFRIARKFKPEAILTIGHGYSWMSAAKVARKLSLPLHFIVHDDWPTLINSQRGRRFVGPRFADCYRQAASRMCVSPFMEEEYFRRYGAHGSVVYPSRTANVICPGPPLIRSVGPDEPLRLAIAGTILSPQMTAILKLLTLSLRDANYLLSIYGPSSIEDVQDPAIDMSRVTFHGTVPNAEIIRRLRSEADVLLVPLSFFERDRPNMSIHFPSKIVDYTAAGLPLLIWGPSYCSAVRWSMSMPGVAQIVETADSEVLTGALRMLRGRALRQSLAQCAVDVGNETFSHRSVQNSFFDCLRSDLSRARGSVAGS